MRKQTGKSKAKKYRTRVRRDNMTNATKELLAHRYPQLSIEGAILRLISDVNTKEGQVDTCQVLTTVPPRVRILNKGAELTCGDRNEAYGNAVTNMQHMAGMLTAYFHNLLTVRIPGINPDTGRLANHYEFTGEDAAMIMTIAKQSRTANRGVSYHEDNYVDAATYAAIAGECADQERPII